MKPNDDDAKLPPRLLDITALAELLGVDPRHIRRLVAERRISIIKWGHLIRFDRSRSGSGSTATAGPRVGRHERRRPAVLSGHRPPHGRLAALPPLKPPHEGAGT